MCNRDMKFLPWPTCRAQRNYATAAHALDVKIPHRSTFVPYDTVDRQMESRSYRLQELATHSFARMQQCPNFTHQHGDSQSLRNYFVLIRNLAVREIET